MPLLQTAAEYCGKKIKNRSSCGSEYSSNFLTHGGPTAGFFLLHRRLQIYTFSVEHRIWRQFAIRRRLGSVDRTVIVIIQGRVLLLLVRRHHLQFRIVPRLVDGPRLDGAGGQHTEHDATERVDPSRDEEHDLPWLTRTLQPRTLIRRHPSTKSVYQYDYLTKLVARQSYMVPEDVSLEQQWHSYGALCPSLITFEKSIAKRLKREQLTTDRHLWTMK